MKVLICCEYSGIIRDEFANHGFDSWSCDLLESETSGNHYKGDVLDILNEGWDLIIAHPPCIYLTYAGMGNWYDEGRAMKRIKAAEFFMQLWEAPVHHICLENPRGIMTKIFRKPDMEIHPYFFGDREMKRTNLWLKNLPVLEYHIEDNLFAKRTATDKPEPVRLGIRKKTGKIKKRYWQDVQTSGHERSRTFPGIAQAMAKQWGQFILKEEINNIIYDIKRPTKTCI